MIVDIPILYRADTIGRHQRRPSKTCARSTEAFEIRERSTSDAPAVFAYTGLVDGSEAVLRLADGILLHPLLPADADGDLDRYRTEIGAYVQGFLVDRSLDGRQDPTVDGPRNGRMQFVDEGDGVVSSCRDLVVAQVQAWLDSRVRLVDGVLNWKRTCRLVSAADVDAVVGLRAAVLYPASHVASVFPPEIGGRPLEDLVREADATRRVRSGVLPEIRVIREDLFEECRRTSATHVDPEPALAFLARRGMSDRRGTGFVPKRMDEKRYLGNAMRILGDGYRRAAEAGDTFEDALLAAEEDLDVSVPIRSDPDRVIAPSSDVGPALRSDRLFYGQASTSIASSVAGRGDLVEILRTPERVVHRLGDGWVLETPDVRAAVPPLFDGSERMLFVSDFDVMVGTLADRAARTRRHGADWQDSFAKSLRHPDAWETPFEDGDREMENALREFARHRLVCVDEGFVGRCPEPAVSVRFSEAGLGVLRLDCSWPLRAAPGMDAPFMFRIDRIADAFAFASSWKPAKNADGLPETVLDADGLLFDDDLWNARVATSMVVANMDGRLALMDDGEAAAFKRVVVHVEAWAVDPASVDDPEVVDAFLRDAYVVASVLERPEMEDMLQPPFVVILSASATRSLERRTVPDAPDDDDAAIAGMGM